MTDQEKSSPVTVGETYDVTIEGIAQKGDGIAKVEGFVVFVPGTKVGDKITIKVEKVLRKFAFGVKVE
ncbi:MAG: TRAM domain-containing protein [Euryarchaeota archaeon]|nr:TRAM domain-containing protein [Euryarchaeota archaeon]MBU4138950.1 TRAM domain-containing protein [Euryarchaeota archaeon]